ncbi:MAG: aminoglycoside phosphotransferase family protein [Bacilli bacterium]|nr:aminoglycoside phosphotransferase family protein [Bacilli bacterium]
MNNKEMPTELRKVADEFLNSEKILEIIEIESGHINQTFMVVMPECNYILQQINTHVFNSPFGMMHNIKEVTEHIRKKVIYEGRDPNRAVLNIVTSRLNQDVVIYRNKYWRCMQYISGAKTYDVIESPQMFLEVGRAVGEFQTLLSDFHTRILDDTISHFHDTPYRYERFQDIVKLDKCNRVKDCQEEINFIISHSDIFPSIVTKLEKKIIPQRVTHNDTKLSNVMIDDETGKALCLIDLDTVMKGSILYDYGDALRIGASIAAEDEVNLDKVKISLELIEAFTRGFLSEVKDIIKPAETDALYDGYLIITCEIAMRFLDDYLDGDLYFRTTHSTHNLERARNQIKLVKEIESSEREIKALIKRVLKELDYSEEFLV